MPSSSSHRRWASWLPYVTLVWALGYGSLRVVWTTTGRPWLPPIGDDLTVFSDLGIIGLAAATAVLAPLLGSTRGPRGVRRAAVVAGWGVTAALILASCLLVLDLVALLFQGIGIPSSPAALASRAGCLAGGVLLGLVTLESGRRLRGACTRCGTTRPGVRPDPRDGAVPAARRVLVVGYLAVLGCLGREIGQAIVGFGPDGNPYASGNLGAAIAFLVAFTLAGTLLPLALVHDWGQVWPRWTLWLAGKRVPRWLVLGPAFLVSGSLVAYFGTGFAQVLFGGAGGGPGDETGFLFAAIVCYLVWGIALGVAAMSYFRRTRPICSHCGG
ncbi:MAG TPA: hypothetical protein VI076_17175 [Actinopolymorphaceae bacterium]